jgi:uncharacterized protein YggE
MENYYKYLIWVGITTLVILSVFLMAKTNQVINTATTANTISFSGEGKVLGKPDIAVVSLSIVTEAITSKAAQDDNSQKSKAVTAFLKGQGIEDKDIKTTGYNIYPQYNYSRNGNPEIRGYQVNQTLEFKVRNLDTVSGILGGVVSAGVNRVDSLRFQIDDPDALKDEAREKAIEDAKTKANELQKQLGIRLGKIVNFYESSSGGSPPPMLFELKQAVGEFGGDGPSVPTGENEVAVNVTLTYEIR